MAYDLHQAMLVCWSRFPAKVTTLTTKLAGLLPKSKRPASFFALAFRPPSSFPCAKRKAPARSGDSVSTSHPPMDQAGVKFTSRMVLRTRQAQPFGPAGTRQHRCAPPRTCAGMIGDSAPASMQQFQRADCQNLPRSDRRGRDRGRLHRRRGRGGAHRSRRRCARRVVPGAASAGASIRSTDESEAQGDRDKGQEGHFHFRISKVETRLKRMVKARRPRRGVSVRWALARSLCRGRGRCRAGSGRRDEEGPGTPRHRF